MELTVNDMRHVHEAMYPARPKWYDIGLQLDVPVDTLDSIKGERGDDGDHLRDMLKRWLKRGGATWGALSDALKSPTIGEHQLAKKLYVRARGHDQVSQPQSESIEDASILSTQDAVVRARSRIERLEENYFTVVTITQEVVKQKAPSIEEFRNTITLLPTLTGAKREQQRYLRDHLEYIYEAKSINQIFGYLNSQVWSYLNFGLLERIVAKYGDPTTKEKMEEYRASIQSFRKDTPLHVFLEAQPEGKCPEISPSLEKTLQEVKVKYKSLSRNSSLEEVERIRLELVRELVLPDFAVALKRIGFGSVSIVWTLPTSLTAILKDKIENESFQFVQWADVVEVAVAGTRVYPPAMARVPGYMKEEPAHQVSAQKILERERPASITHRRTAKDGRLWLIRFVWGILLAALVVFLRDIPLAALLQHWYGQSPTTEQSTTCTELEKPSLLHGSDKFVPNNLPYVRGPFVGRDSELQELSNMLLAGSAYADVAMVSIFGAPAVGKSTLAIQIGHVLANEGISVRYVNLNEAHHLFARHADASGNLKPTSIQSTANDDTTALILHKADVSYTEKKYVLTSPKKLTAWAKKLTNDSVLILDDCDDFLQRNKTHENNFKDILIDLLEASKYLRILTTSRAQMLIVGAFRPYLLQELDPSSAVTLLQLKSNLITIEEGKVIAELVGNNPLALGIVAGLINTKSSPWAPHAIVDELQTLSQNTLSSSILTVLKLSYNYLDDRVQVCSHYLSHFAGSCHRAAAQSILSMCNLNDPEYCLRTLVERSLLEEYWYAGQPRYQFHRLIGEFLQYVQTEYSDAHAIKIKTKFNLNYQLYYSQDILSLSQIHSRSPDNNEIISRLEHDMYNFQNILQQMVEQQLDIKSALNIAYGFSNSTDFFIKMFRDCRYCFVELLEALVHLFDQQMLQISHRIGKEETALLYFNLISSVKRWLISNRNLWIDCTMPCYTVCRGTFVNHPSRVEKLLAVSNTLDAYYYHPLTCYLDCFPELLSTALGVIGVLITLLINQNKKATVYKFMFLLLLFHCVVILGFFMSHARTIIIPLTVLTFINYVYIMCFFYKQGQRIQLLFTIIGASLLLIGITMSWRIFTSSAMFYVYLYYGLVVMLLIILLLWLLPVIYGLLCYCSNNTIIQIIRGLL